MTYISDRNKKKSSSAVEDEVKPATTAKEEPFAVTTDSTDDETSKEAASKEGTTPTDFGLTTRFYGLGILKRFHTNSGIAVELNEEGCFIPKNAEELQILQWHLKNGRVSTEKPKEAPEMKPTYAPGSNVYFTDVETAEAKIADGTINNPVGDEEVIIDETNSMVTHTQPKDDQPKDDQAKEDQAKEDQLKDAQSKDAF